jgi:hypothetical protein
MEVAAAASLNAADGAALLRCDAPDADAGGEEAAAPPERPAATEPPPALLVAAPACASREAAGHAGAAGASGESKHGASHVAPAQELAPACATEKTAAEAKKTSVAARPHDLRSFTQAEPGGTLRGTRRWSYLPSTRMRKKGVADNALEVCAPRRCVACKHSC